MFVERFKTLLEKNDVTAYKVAKETNISQGLMREYQKGIKTPSSQNIIKIADYFGCSVDYLLGRTDSPTAINSHNTVNGSNNIIGNGSGNRTENTLSEQESALMNIFNKLDVVSQAKLLVYATELEKEKNLNIIQK